MRHILHIHYHISLKTDTETTEKFDQAITDYTAGLSLKTQLLPLSSRQIAEAHYKLSMVLDLTSGRLAQAIEHAEGALNSVEARLEELRMGLRGELPPVDEDDDVVVVGAEGESGKSKEKKAVDLKGKGKAKAGVQSGLKLVRDELVQRMSKTQIESEIRELEGLREELGLKVRANS